MCFSFLFRRICVFWGFEIKKKSFSFLLHFHKNSIGNTYKEWENDGMISRVRVTGKSESFYLEAKTSNHQTSSCWTNFFFPLLIFVFFFFFTFSKILSVARTHTNNKIQEEKLVEMIFTVFRFFFFAFAVDFFSLQENKKKSMRIYFVIVVTFNEQRMERKFVAILNSKQNRKWIDEYE